MSKIIDFKEEEIDQIATYVAELSKVFGFLDEDKRKYFVMRGEFRKLRNEGNTADEAEIILAEKSCVSKERVHAIIYRKKEK